MIRIADMQPEHAPAVAELHAQALQGDFLPSLGAPFLRVLYAGILDLNLGLGFVALDTDRVCGFVLGTLDSGTLFRRLLRARGLRFAIAALRPALRRPALLLRFAETLLYPGKEGQIHIDAEFVSMAVADEYRNQGIASRLVERLNQAFDEHGVAEYKVAIHQDNVASNRFHQKLGFQLRYTFMLYGKVWNLYTYHLGRPAGAEGVQE